MSFRASSAAERVRCPVRLFLVVLQQLIGSLERLGWILFDQINTSQQFARSHEVRARLESVFQLQPGRLQLALGQQRPGVVETQQVIVGILGDQALQIGRCLIHLLLLPAGQQEGRVHRDRVGVLRVFLQKNIHQLIRLRIVSVGRVQLDQALLIHRFVLRKRGDPGFVLLFRQLEFAQPEK